MHPRKLIFSVIIENRSNNYFTSCNSNVFGGKSASDLNLIFVSFLSKSSELIFADLTKFLILLHISLLFFNVTFYSSVRISVKYLSPLLSSICSLDMLIIRYKGFKLAKNNIFVWTFFHLDDIRINIFDVDHLIEKVVRMKFDITFSCHTLSGVHLGYFLNEPF